MTPTFHDPVVTFTELLSTLRETVTDTLTQATSAERCRTIGEVLRTAGTLYGGFARDLARQQAGEPSAIQVSCPACASSVRSYPTFQQAVRALEAHANTSHANKDIALTPSWQAVVGSDRSAIQRWAPNVPALAVLEHQLRAALHRLLIDSSPTSRAALINPVRRNLLQLEPVLAELAPQVLDLMRAPTGVGTPMSAASDDQLVDDLLNADRHLHEALRGLGVDAYQPSTPHSAANPVMRLLARSSDVRAGLGTGGA